MSTETNERHDRYKNKWVVLATMLLMTFMSTLDGSIVNVALPTMAKELSVTTQSISWVVSSYLVGICTVILVFGKLGDLKGKMKIFKIGVFLFTLGSLICGFSPSLPILIASRILQAMGAAASMATSQGIITEAFPKHERGRALGLNGTFVALGSMTGAPLGGFLISIFSWNYIFLINLPIGILAFIFCQKFLPKEHVKARKFPDVKGFLLFVITIVSFFVAIIEGEVLNYTNPLIITCFAVSIISFILFVYIEKSVAEPMLDLDIFKSKLFSISIFCAFISFVALFCLSMVNPFYLQYTLKYSPAITGLLMMFYSVIISFVSPFSGTLSDKIGSEFLTFIGLVIMGVGLFLMTLLSVSTPIPLFIGFIIIIALGAGLFQSPNTSLIMSTVNKDQLGIAGSVNALVRNLGMSVGTALATSLLYNRMSHKAGYKVLTYIEGRDDIFMYGMRYVYMVAGAFCIIGAIITFVRLHNSRVKHF
ncbi:MAG: MFS transporter [Sebaldella sp.]|nr:MFS transporter [Sebaldella sp.]